MRQSQHDAGKRPGLTTNEREPVEGARTRGGRPGRAVGLPIRDVLGDGVGDAADEVGRDLDAVELVEVALDVAQAHPTGVEGKDALVESRDATHTLPNELGVERALAIARDVDGDLAVVGEERFGRVAVASVVGALRLGSWLEAELGGHLALERLLDEAGGELLEQHVLVEKLVR